MIVGDLRERRLKAAAANVTEPEPLSAAQRDACCNLEGALACIRPSEAAAVMGDWRYWARPTQLAPADPSWVIWLILAGRGWGKTRTGAEWVKSLIEEGEVKSLGLIGPTLSDVWDQMVYGTEDAPGVVRLFSHLPDGQRPWVNRNDKKIFFYNPDSSVRAEAKVFTAEKPEVRGPNIGAWWCDELAKWPHLRACWDNIEMTLRAKGKRPPRVCITTTPRPLELIKELLDDPSVRFTFGSMFANAANLAPTFIARMQRKYAGSRLGQQELFGLLLGDNPDALWHMTTIEAHRWTRPEPPPLRRVVVAVDPAVSTNRRSDLTGIVVIGVDYSGQIYVLADYTGVHLLQDTKRPKALVIQRPPSDEAHKQPPEEWGELVIKAVWHHQADAVVCERNRGGDLVRANVQNSERALTGAAPIIRIQEVIASRGKVARAEPVAAIYEQGRGHHVGAHPELEAEMTEWNPQLTPVSPNRIDALVWGAHGLLPELGGEEQRTAEPVDTITGIAALNRFMMQGDDYDPL